jgi:shikimate kinase
MSRRDPSHGIAQPMVGQRKHLIYLLGFMGAGKTTVGLLLAQQLGWRFIDLDATIEAGQGATVREIFERAGEAYFRRIERAALIEASNKEPAVVALGGGTFVQPANYEFIRATGGITVWLDCSLEELWQRCEGKNNRPLFRDPLSFAQLLEQRLPYYRLADYRISTEGREPQEVARQILCLEVLWRRPT